MKFRLFCVALAIGALIVPGRQGSAQEQFPYQIFERYLEPLAQQIGMPGLSAVIVQEEPTDRAGSPGRASTATPISNARFRRPSTRRMPIGGMTQALTGVLIGVCIDRYGFEVDQDIRTFAPAFPVRETSVRQVLAHATDGRFRYDPALYSRSRRSSNRAPSSPTARPPRSKSSSVSRRRCGAPCPASISRGPKAPPPSRSSTPRPSRAIRRC